MSKKTRTLDRKIEQWALRLAELSESGAEFDTDEVAAFKAVAGYFSASRKLNASETDDEDNGGFASARKRIAEATEQASGSEDGFPTAHINGSGRADPSN